MHILVQIDPVEIIDQILVIFFTAKNRGIRENGKLVIYTF